MPNTVTVALAGVGGYGGFYLNHLAQGAAEHHVRLVAGIDPAGEKAPRWNELKSAGVAMFTSLNDYYAQSDRADIMILALPIHLHAPETIRALEQGMHVVCEKPLCATLDEAKAMIAARDKAGKIVTIGYQWSFGDAVQKLKADVMNGVLGKPRRLKCVVLWPRKRSYYQRSSWAGAKQARDGAWVLDSPANNATSHYLHNILYVLGEQIDRSTSPVETVAELYRANPITNFDTGAARFRTQNGAEVLYYCAHAVERTVGPRFAYEFEKATVRYELDGEFIATFSDGTQKNYGNPDPDSGRKLWRTADAIRSGNGAAPLACGIEAALGQTRAIDAMHRSCTEIAEFPADLRRVTTDEKGDTLTYVDGLIDTLLKCYDESKLPHELGVPWAKKGNVIKD
jgi:predicted dehydrogenase